MVERICERVGFEVTRAAPLPPHKLMGADRMPLQVPKCGLAMKRQVPTSTIGEVSDVRGCFEVEVRMDATKLTGVIIAGFGYEI